MGGILKKWQRLWLQSRQGQASVEYCLMVLVVVSLVLATGKRIRVLMFGPGECPNDSLLCKVIANMSAPGFLEGQYRYYTLKK